MAKKEKIENPLEKRKKLPKAVEKYEESLVKQLFEEDLKKKLEKLNKSEEAEFYEDTRQFHHKSKTGKWDVPLHEQIMYFDPELSYELTGYKPLTMTLGLDFDPEPFMETGKVYTETGAYTTWPKGSKPYNDFWREQMRRCVEGYTVNGYRITGDHYFFLNFYRMSVVNKDQSKMVRGRTESFPSFIAKQYEFFHYLEMCEYIGKDVCMLKARGLKTWPLW